MTLIENKENIDNEIKDVERKRIKTLSKKGNIYYKISPEVNRLAQHKHYHDNKEAIAVKTILQRLEKTGNVPQYASVKKFPEIITEERMVKSYRVFKDTNTDPEKFI